ncbi:Protein prenyltransferase alpha subunit repeat-containing protein 1-B [Armadillidium nasatum]|uniref:Protein prenyltransferase alpha subunit repeat-containing protein 1-B n=1 Tax=Armadillidium nasatum TaxID=96803 RepID=A0A5N5T7I4_9CRUS|nr:Protein prenyltransferase alpha subunit repeat-containing protein 1-B [Armadillidium nasatum]
MEEATCERIIKSVDTIIRKDSALNEFGIIQSASEVNKSPVIHIDHKLGLESWCVKYVYKYAYTVVMRYSSIGGYNYSESVIRGTQFCLLLKPEVTTFWNIRKKIILKGLLNADVDLLLSRLVLTLKPKCIEAFQHRRWLYSAVLSDQNSGSARNNVILNNNIGVPGTLKDFLWAELDLCTWTASKKPNNYHSWNHRLWVVKKLSSSVEDTEISELLKVEYNSSKTWISYHVSEHSGMHYRFKILDEICCAFEKGRLNLVYIDSNLNTVKEIYLKDLKLSEDWLQSYPDHEALFYYRRNILAKLQYLFSNNGQKASPPPPAYKRSCIETIDSEWNAVIQRELKLFEEIKGHSDHYTQLCRQHLNWINNNISY